QPSQVSRYVPTGATTNEPSPGSPARRPHARGVRRTPPDLSAPRSQTSDSTMNRTKNDSPVPLIAQARPSITPPTSRHGRGPHVGTPSLRSTPHAAHPA